MFQVRFITETFASVRFLPAKSGDFVGYVQEIPFKVIDNIDICGTSEKYLESFYKRLRFFRIPPVICKE